MGDARVVCGGSVLARKGSGVDAETCCQHHPESGSPARHRPHRMRTGLPFSAHDGARGSPGRHPPSTASHRLRRAGGRALGTSRAARSPGRATQLAHRGPLPGGHRRWPRRGTQLTRPRAWHAWAPPVPSARRAAGRWGFSSTSWVRSSWARVGRRRDNDHTSPRDWERCGSRATGSPPSAPDRRVTSELCIVHTARPSHPS